MDGWKDPRLTCVPSPQSHSLSHTHTHRHELHHGVCGQRDPARLLPLQLGAAEQLSPQPSVCQPAGRLPLDGHSLLLVLDSLLCQDIDMYNTISNSLCINYVMIKVIYYCVVLDTCKCSLCIHVCMYNVVL